MLGLGPKASRLDEGTRLISRLPCCLFTPLCSSIQDKEKVAEYKAAIKEKLTREGLIRGQPRSAYRQHASSTVVPSQQYQTPAVAGPGPNTTLRRAVSGSSVDYTFRSSYGPQFQQTQGIMPVLPGKSSFYSSVRAYMPHFRSPSS